MRGRPIEEDPRYLSQAIQLARQASTVVLDLLRKPITQSRKADHSIVTEADLRSDEIIRTGLANAFPDHAILTEENGLSGNAESANVWLVDPLDGTKAYAKGIPGFSIMIGLLRNGSPHLGVVLDPLEGFLYYAIRGQGAYLESLGNTVRLYVSERENFETMPLVTSTGFPKEKLLQIVSKFHTPVCDPINSVGIKVGMLVRQVGDIYLNHHSVHFWDTCAPQIILEEAGGLFTDIHGTPLTYSLQGSNSHAALTLASNGKQHGDLVSFLSEVFKESGH